MRKEAERWFIQSADDLAVARDNCEGSHYAWACFAAQQSGEKALKSCLYQQGRTSVVTHSLKILLKECSKYNPAFSDTELDDAARILDNYYILTRYPNGLDEDLAPAEYYDKKDATQCIQYATLILNAVKKFLGK